MGSKGDYLENEIMDHILGDLTFSAANSLWIALYTAVPTDTRGGTEVGAGDYDRIEHTNSATTWQAASAGATQNIVELTFAQATSAWGTIVGFAILDNSVKNSGNLYYWGSLTTAKAVNSGDTAKFATGDLDVSED
jgi:hypothetical protein